MFSADVEFNGAIYRNWILAIIKTKDISENIS